MQLHAVHNVVGAVTSLQASTGPASPCFEFKFEPGAFTAFLHVTRAYTPAGLLQQNSLSLQAENWDEMRYVLTWHLERKTAVRSVCIFLVSSAKLWYKNYVLYNIEDFMDENVLGGT